MRSICCVCGIKAEGLITFGEFVCFTCHEEATGERPKPIKIETKIKYGGKKRHRVTGTLIQERMDNLRKERSCEEVD